MLRSKCPLLILVILLVLAELLLVEADNTQMIDVVYLNNGGIVKGTIVEIVPDEVVKIQTFDGGIVTYDMAQVKRVTKEPMLFSHVVSRKEVLLVVSRKEPVLGVLTSMLIPGLGHVYGGNTSKGIKFFAAETATGILMTITASKISSETSYFPAGILPVVMPITAPKISSETSYTSALPNYLGEYPVYCMDETNKKMLALTISLAVVLAGTRVYDLIDSYKTVKKWKAEHHEPMADDAPLFLLT